MKTAEIQRIYHRNGHVFQEVSFVGGKINGVIREWHKNGVLAKEVPMQDGLRHGVCKQWNDKGELLGTFEMNMGIGTSKQWFPNGQIEFEASIVNEAFTGRLRRWNEQGELVQETFFLKNKTVPKDEHDWARQSNPSLPSYPTEPDEARPVLVKDTDRRRGHERLIARLLSTRTVSAMEWLKTDSPNSRKTLGELNTAKSIALVTAFYDAGAVDVLAADIDTDPKGNENADKFVVILPTDQAKRQAIRKLSARRRLQFSPENETGHSHLAVFLG